MDDKFTFNITEHIGKLSENKNGWSLELNKVSWGDRDAKFDIRSWDANHEKMSKGVTFTAQELSALKSLLNTIEV